MLSIVLQYSENNINIANETEYHEHLHEYHSKVSGVLSSKTTDIYDYSKQNTVVSSNVSAGELAISSKKDTNITGSNVVADNNVSVKTGGNLNIGSAEQASESEYIKSVKKSGLLSGGGLGFTIGKEKQKDQYANQNVEQVRSTGGSVKGSVNLDAEKATRMLIKLSKILKAMAVARFAETYLEREFGQQVVAQIPWGYNIVIMDKVSSL